MHDRYKGLRGSLVRKGFETILPFLKPIEHLIADDAISEVMVNGSDRVFIKKNGFLEQAEGISMSDREP